MLHVKTGIFLENQIQENIETQTCIQLSGIFLEMSYTREHRNFKLIYNYQVFSWKSHTLKSQFFFLEKSHTYIHSQQYNNVNSFLH